MAIIKGASVVAGNDSGPLHIAAAQNVPTVSIYGPTDPAVVGPYGQMDGVLQAGGDRPRTKRYSRLAQHRIENITGQQVFDKIAETLRIRKNSPICNKEV